MYLGGVENQAIGSMTQGLSRALSEQLVFNKSNVTSLDWVSYPILRFKDSPPITFSVIQRTDIPAVDSGSVAAAGVLRQGRANRPRPRSPRHSPTRSSTRLVSESGRRR